MDGGGRDGPSGSQSSPAQQRGWGLRYCMTGQVEICRTKRASAYKIDGVEGGIWFRCGEVSLQRIPMLELRKGRLGRSRCRLREGRGEARQVRARRSSVVLGCGASASSPPLLLRLWRAARAHVTGRKRDLNLRLPIRGGMGMERLRSKSKAGASRQLLSAERRRKERISDRGLSGALRAVGQGFDLVRRRREHLCKVGPDSGDTVTSVYPGKAIQRAGEHQTSYSVTGDELGSATRNAKSLGPSNVTPLISGLIPGQRLRDGVFESGEPTSRQNLLSTAERIERIAPMRD